MTVMNDQSKLNTEFIGDSCLSWLFGEGISQTISDQVITAYRHIKSKRMSKILDLVPSYNALSVHFDLLTTNTTDLIEKIDGLIEESFELSFNHPTTTHHMPVVYDGEDLKTLADGKGLSTAEVVTLHQQKKYSVAMIGFKPHFNYLLGLNPQLETPRLKSPRARVAAGAVGIGGLQTGVYPEQSPGGWNLIGRTQPERLKVVNVGDTVVFEAVEHLPTLLLNCDIGERGTDNKTDIAIMKHLFMANIACGGHAGDHESIRFFRSLAREHKVQVSAHLSYPDRDNFGRVSLSMSESELHQALNQQMSLMTDVCWVKFHGALYNNACEQKDLALSLVNWCVEKNITHVVTQEGSEPAVASRAQGVTVVNEFFAERRYKLNDQNRLALVPRSKTYAILVTIDECREHIKRFIDEQIVEVVIGESSSGELMIETYPTEATTVCVHSDSPIALELIERLATL